MLKILLVTILFCLISCGEHPTNSNAKQEPLTSSGPSQIYNNHTTEELKKQFSSSMNGVQDSINSTYGLKEKLNSLTPGLSSGSEEQIVQVAESMLAISLQLRSNVFEKKKFQEKLLVISAEMVRRGQPNNEFSSEGENSLKSLLAATNIELSTVDSQIEVMKSSLINMHVSSQELERIKADSQARNSDAHSSSLVLISDSNVSTFYVDMNSIVNIGGDIKRARSLISFKEHLTPTLSVVHLKDFDCTNGLSRLITSKMYSEINGQGKNIGVITPDDIGQNPNEFFPAPNQRELEIVCGIK